VIPAAGPPAAPVNLIALGSGNSVRFSWTPPSTGTPPAGYTLIGRQAPGSPVLGTAPVGNVTSATITLPNGSFYVTVRGSNPQGTGTESTGVVVNLPAPIIPPDPPRNLTATVSGNAVTLSWLPPANSPPGIGYTLTASLAPGGPAIAVFGLAAGHTSLAVTSVPVGTYYVRVVATNEGGPSLPSNEATVAVAPLQAPGPPTLNAAQVNGANVTLSWTPASSGGPATSYVIVASLTSGGAAIATLPIAGVGTTVTAPPGTYFVRVAAVNAVGTSALSNEITVTVL
jgi:predicted phage tail protein